MNTGSDGKRTHIASISELYEDVEDCINLHTELILQIKEFLVKLSDRMTNYSAGVYCFRLHSHIAGEKYN